MLQRFRDVFQGKLRFVIVGGVALLLLVWGSSYYLSNTGANSFTRAQGTVAKVDGQPIARQDLDRLVQMLRQQLPPDQQGSSAALNALALQTLIERAVLSQEISRLGLSIPEPELVMLLKRIPAFQENGAFSPARFGLMTAKLGLTEAEFLVKLREDALISQFREGLENSVFTLPSEVQLFGELLGEERSIQGVTIVPAAYVSKVTISDQAVSQYYTQHLADFMTPSQVSVDYITLSLPEIAKDVSVSEQEILEYGKAHPKEFEIPEERRVAQIIVPLSKQASIEQEKKAASLLLEIQKQLQAGASFADLAKQYSGDPISAQKGGDLGWVKLGDLPAQAEKIVFSLTTVGEISSAIRTEYGFQIFTLQEMRPAQNLSDADIRLQILDKLKLNKAKQKYADALDQLAQLTYEHPDSLKTAADQLNVPVLTSPFFAQTGGEGIFQNSALVRAAFGKDVLEQRLNSNLLTISSNQAVVIRLNRYQAALARPLAQVKDTVVAQLTQAQAKSLAEQEAQAWLAMMRQGKPLAQLAASKKLTVTSMEHLTRTDKTVDPNLLFAVFNVPMSVRSRPGLATLSNGEIVLFHVTAQKPGQMSDEQRTLDQKILLRLLAQASDEIAVAQLVNAAQVKVFSGS